MARMKILTMKILTMNIMMNKLSSTTKLIISIHCYSSIQLSTLPFAICFSCCECRVNTSAVDERHPVATTLGI